MLDVYLGTAAITKGRKGYKFSPRLPTNTQPLLLKGLGSLSPDLCQIWRMQVLILLSNSFYRNFPHWHTSSQWHFSLTLNQQYLSQLVWQGWEEEPRKSFFLFLLKKFHDSIAVRDNLISLWMVELGTGILWFLQFSVCVSLYGGWCHFVYMVLEDVGTEVESGLKVRGGHTTVDLYVSAWSAVGQPSAFSIPWEQKDSTSWAPVQSRGGKEIEFCACGFFFCLLLLIKFPYKNCQERTQLLMPYSSLYQAGTGCLPNTYFQILNCTEGRRRGKRIQTESLGELGLDRSSLDGCLLVDAKISPSNNSRGKEHVLNT